MATLLQYTQYYKITGGFSLISCRGTNLRQWSHTKVLKWEDIFCVPLYLTVETSNLVFLKKFLDVLKQPGKAHCPSLEVVEDVLTGTSVGDAALLDGDVGGGMGEKKGEE